MPDEEQAAMRPKYFAFVDYQTMLRESQTIRRGGFEFDSASLRLICVVYSHSKL